MGDNFEEPTGVYVPYGHNENGVWIPAKKDIFGKTSFDEDPATGKHAAEKVKPNYSLETETVHTKTRSITVGDEVSISPGRNSLCWPRCHGRNSRQYTLKIEGSESDENFPNAGIKLRKGKDGELIISKPVVEVPKRISIPARPEGSNLSEIFAEKTEEHSRRSS
jgi:hypothetical protein